jgi:amino acid transporter
MTLIPKLFGAAFFAGSHPLSLLTLSLLTSVAFAATAIKPSLGKRFKRFVLGAPIATAKAAHERLSVGLGLPVFASDALSSVAYATEAILGVLILSSLALFRDQLWIGAAISLLIIIVATSYRQTIHAYPSGGGSYIVASENLGETPGLIAGAALMIDYVLTVSVSVAAGVAALVSAFPNLHPLMVPMSFGFIALIAFGNLRGVRESGAMFALPTYGFLIGMIGLILFGIYRSIGTPPMTPHIVAEAGAIGKEAALPILFVVLRAFAAGCTALTGIEAVSNGVPAFKAPEAKNAAKTLAIMAGLLTVLFLGTGYLAMHLPTISLLDSHNPQYRTLVSQIAGWAFGANSIGFFYIQFATAAILILAANTSFADFPRLSSLLSRDGYLPRSLSRQGDRLVFQNGIVLLALTAGALIWAFHGELDQLLPLYAVGVFLAFTLSQTGMVIHWFRSKERGWQKSIVINGLGALSTGVVMAIILATKFTEGAWLVVVFVLILFGVFKAIKVRYRSVTDQLESGVRTPERIRHHTQIVLVPRFHAGIVKALDYALSLGPDSSAIHISIDERSVPRLMEQWEKYEVRVPLVVLDSPFRSLVDPVLAYVDEIQSANPEEVVTVIVPEAVPMKWIHGLLKENVASQIKAALGVRRNVVITNVRYLLD